jgi:hypothetical protein
MPPLLSIRAYARHRGVSQTAVQKAIADGRITRRKDGKIDSARADKQWAERTDHSKPLNSVTGDPKLRRKPGAPSTPMGATRPRRAASATTEDESPTGNGHDPEPLSSYAKARGEREKFLAKMARLNYEREAGLVIAGEALAGDIYEASRAARDAFNTLPARLASAMAATTEEAQCHDILEDAIREVLNQLSSALSKTIRSEKSSAVAGDGSSSTPPPAASRRTRSSRSASGRMSTAS